MDADAKPIPYPSTPDGRYFIVKDRLWRKSNPALSSAHRELLVHELMNARRALRGIRSHEERASARLAVDSAKRALGERGPVWWTDGAPDFNRKLVRNTPYADWYASVQVLGQPSSR